MLVLLKLVFLFGLSSVRAAPAFERVVTLSPSLAEWSAEILGTSRAVKVVVGVSEYSDYPLEMKKVAQVGPYPQIDIEKVASLKPTLVIASAESNRPDQIEKLRRLKLNVQVMPTEKFGEMEAWIRKLGSVLGEPKGAEGAAKRWHEGIRRLKSQVPGAKTTSKRVMIQVQDSPIIAVGGDSFLNEAFAMVGYQNIFSDLKQSYPKISREAVLAANPDVIFIMDLMGKDEDSKNTVAEWNKFASLKAVQNHDLRTIAADDYARCSLRLLNALKQLH